MSIYFETDIKATHQVLASLGTEQENLASAAHRSMNRHQPLERKNAMNEDRRAKKTYGNTILTAARDERQEALDELDSWLDAAKRLYNNTNLISSANAEEDKADDKLELSEYKGIKGSYWDRNQNRPELLKNMWKYIKSNGGDPFKMYQVLAGELPRKAFEGIADGKELDDLRVGMLGVENMQWMQEGSTPELYGPMVCEDGQGKEHLGSDYGECMEEASKRINTTGYRKSVGSYNERKKGVFSPKKPDLK